MNEADTLRMTLSDVAAPAQVQRPVVSMWRKRSAGLGSPVSGAQLPGRRRGDSSTPPGRGWLHADRAGNNRRP